MKQPAALGLVSTILAMKFVVSAGHLRGFKAGRQDM